MAPLFIQVLDGETSEDADLVLVIDDEAVVADLARSLARRLGASIPATRSTVVALPTTEKNDPGGR